MAEAEKERSVTWVIVMVMALIAAIGWGFMAAGYAHSEEGWRDEGVQGTEGPMSIRRASARARADFFANALHQIPNCVSVISFNFANRIWLPIVIAGLEGLTLLVGFKMKQLEKEFNAPPQRRRPSGR